MKKTKEERDQLAGSLVAEATKDMFATVYGKNPAAVLLGKLGGERGGKARAKALSPERRKQIAIDAAQIRWGKRRALMLERLGVANKALEKTKPNE